jgi:uncharacterized protein YndB with AHSA1/START domain
MEQPARSVGRESRMASLVSQRMNQEDPRLKRTVELDTDIREVWSALTRTERLSEWFGARALEAELRPGGRITFEREGELWRGLVEVVDRPHVFAFRWLPRPGEPANERTRVEFRLERIPAGTRLTVLEGTLWEGMVGAAAPPVGARG